MTIESNLSITVSDFFVKKNAVVAAQVSISKAEEEAERKDLQVGACYEVTSSVPTVDGREEHEATPAAHKDGLTAAVQADDENPRNVKDVQETTAPPPREFKCVFGSDIKKSECLPGAIESPPALINEVVRQVAHRRQSQSFHLTHVGKDGQPLLGTSAPCKGTAKPGREPPEQKSDLTMSTKTSASSAEANERRIRGRNKTVLRTRLDSLHMSYRTPEALTLAQQHL